VRYRTSRHHRTPVWLCVALGGLGCQFNPSASVRGGAGGASAGMASTGGTSAVQPLTDLSVSPANATVQLVADPVSGNIQGQATFVATGSRAGVMQDVSSTVEWTSDDSVSVHDGVATALAPGTYTVTASSGTQVASATLTATYSGQQTASGFNATGDFAGTPTATTASIAYPSAGALVPSNLAPFVVHIQRPGAQTEADLTFAGDGLALDYFAPCEAGAPGKGCYVTLPSSLSTLLVGSSQNHDIQLTARLASPGGADLVASPPINVAWAALPLQGGLYYWTTITAGAVAGYTPPADAASGTAVQRYDFSQAASAPELVWTDQGAPPAFSGSPASAANSAPTDGNSAWGQSTCVGCHAITPDGSAMAMVIGGSGPSDLAFLDIATKTLALVDPAAAVPNATGLDALDAYRDPNFATLITFNPAGTMMVDMYRSNLFMRGSRWTPGQTAPISFDPNTSVAFTAVPSGEGLTDPFWSSDGSFFAFSSFNRASAGLPNGDLKDGAQVWIATSDGMTIHDDATLVAPRENGYTKYNPAFNSDSTLVVFNRSSCDGPMTPGSYGQDPCDGYDDPSATLWLTSPTGATPTPLTAAGGPANSDDSWPRFSPNVGKFRGGRLYWLAFSSRRPYGLQINQAGLASSKPQLWFAGVVVDAASTATPSADPSFAAVWLPNQNHDQANPTGNHVPQWVKTVVAIDPG
jgi:hypothetical protein